MKTRTQKEWKKYETLRSDLLDFAEEYVKAVTGHVYSINNAYIEGDKVYIEYDDSYYGCTSQAYESCPLSYLWTADWRIVLRAEEEERGRLEKEKRREHTLEAANQAELKDKALYLELKERFDNE